MKTLTFHFISNETVFFFSLAYIHVHFKWLLCCVVLCWLHPLGFQIVSRTVLLALFLFLLFIFKTSVGVLVVVDITEITCCGSVSVRVRYYVRNETVLFFFFLFFYYVCYKSYKNNNNNDKNSKILDSLLNC